MLETAPAPPAMLSLLKVGVQNDGGRGVVSV